MIAAANPHLHEELMSDIPQDLRYTPEHGWVRSLAGQVLELGVTEHGQDALGDLVSVGLPEVGRRLAVGDNYVSLESAKTVFELTAPVAGEVTAVNTGLADSPEQINQDPYGKGWLVKILVADQKGLSALLTPTAYEAVVKSDGG
jgi:glycine cleavage system H protein